MSDHTILTWLNALLALCSVATPMAAQTITGYRLQRPCAVEIDTVTHMR